MVRLGKKCKGLNLVKKKPSIKFIYDNICTFLKKKDVRTIGKKDNSKYNFLDTLFYF